MDETRHTTSAPLAASRSSVMTTGIIRLSRAALPAALAHRLVIFGLAVSAAARLLAAAVDLVHGRPRAPFSFVARQAAFFVAFFDVLGLPLLLVGVLALVAAWHT